MLKKGCLVVLGGLVAGILMCSSWLFVGIATDGKGLSALAAEPTPTIPAPMVEFTDEQLDAIADRLAEKLDPGPDLVEIAQVLHNALKPILDKLGEILDLLKERAAASPTIETAVSPTGEVFLNVEIPSRCRQGPDMMYPTLNYLSPGDRVRILGLPVSVVGWYQVQHPNRVCWVFDGAGSVEGDITSLPFVTPPPVPTPRPEPEEEEDKDRPPACGDGVPESHSATVDEAWTPSGEWRVVNFWSNQIDPNFGDHKLLLEPGQNPGLLGGGSSWSWPDNCGDAAHANYEANGLDPVKLSELEDMGLVK